MFSEQPLDACRVPSLCSRNQLFLLAHCSFATPLHSTSLTCFLASTLLAHTHQSVCLIVFVCRRLVTTHETVCIEQKRLALCSLYLSLSCLLFLFFFFALPLFCASLLLLSARCCCAPSSSSSSSSSPSCCCCCGGFCSLMTARVSSTALAFPAM